MTIPSEQDMKFCELSLELEELLSLNEKQKQPPDCAKELCMLDFDTSSLREVEEILTVMSYRDNLSHIPLK